jgi:hypothetical protein
VWARIQSLVSSDVELIILIQSRRRRNEFGQCLCIPSFDHNCWKL